MFGVLAVVCAAIVLLGIISAPVLVDFIAPGFHAEKRELAIHLVRILFPGTAMLVMSAWCLGVLNSHRRFLLSYTAPVAMNISMIACLAAFGRHSIQDRLAIDLAWSFVLGSVLQFLVQLPRVLQLLPGIPADRSTCRSEEVRTVIRNFGPIFLGRGVVQVSAFVDSIIASKLPNGAVSALSYGQTVAILPISLVQHVGFCGGTASSVERCWRTAGGGGLSSQAAERGSAANRFLRRALRRRVSLSWRCGFGRAFPVREIRSR